MQNMNAATPLDGGSNLVSGQPQGTERGFLAAFMRFPQNFVNAFAPTPAMLATPDVPSPSMDKDETLELQQVPTPKMM